MTKKDDYYNDFLLKDYEQQYQEYRKEEASRIHYVEFLISLVTATLAFFALFYSHLGFPATNIYPVLLLLFFAIILFCVGYGVKEICISTRESQNKTAEYLDVVAEYFINLNQNKKIKEARKGISFIKEPSEKMPVFHLIKIVIFLIGVLGAVIVYSLSRIIFFVIPEWRLIFDPRIQINIISIIAGFFSLIIIYLWLRRRMLKRLKPEK